MTTWQQTLERIDAGQLYPVHRTLQQGVNQPTCIVEGKEYLCFSANNYLGLSHHPAVKAAAFEAIEDDGVGPGSSRVMGGSSVIVERLERDIADWTGFEGCITFPTGYMANSSVFRALLSPFFPDQQHAASIVFPDQFSHGSIVDGCRASGARVVPFRHNNFEDLQRKLQHFAHIPNKLIVTEGVFCLEGLTIDLPKYIAIAKEHRAMLMIDDAHGIGIVGPRGAGIAALYDLQSDIDIYMGCLDKALGGTGGFLCGSKDMVRFLRVGCRAALFSSALPSMLAGAMRQAILIAQASDDLRSKLLDQADHLRQLLNDHGFTVLGSHRHPAVPLLIGPDQLGLQVSEFLWNRQIFLPLMRWPAVPANCSRFRINVTVGHTESQIEQFVTALRAARDTFPDQWL